MSAERLWAGLEEHRLVAIVRSGTGADLALTLRILIEAGIRCLEVTIPTPGALDAISSLRIEYGPEVVIGTGTVLSPEDVRRSADAGAEFVVSPGFQPDVVAAAIAQGLGVLPGVLTPTEAVRASQSGATAVKLFPASTVGPAFITALHAPLPDLPIVAVGGIELDDVLPWLDVGALAVGVGAPLVDGGLAGLRDRASRFVAAAGRIAT